MWNERYAREEFVFGTEPNDYLRQQASLILPGEVLCLADGEGRNGVYLATLGYQVTSVDLADAGLRKAHQLAAARGVSLHTEVADLSDWDLGEKRWSGIVSIFCHLPQPLRSDLHRRVLIALKPGGILILEAYRPEQLIYGTGGPPDSARMSDLTELRLDFADLAELDAGERVREISEGILHNGTSAVVQFTGKSIP